MKTTLNMDRLPPAEVVVRAQSIHDQINGNANFTTPNPTLVTFQGKITAAQTAIVAQDGAIDAARTAVVERREASEDLMDTIRLMAAYVEHASGGDEAKILSSGFGVRGESSGPEGSPPAEVTVSILIWKPTNNNGEMQLKIKPVTGGLYYEAHTTSTPENAASWVMRKTDSKSSMLIPGLTSGTKVYVRVRAKVGDGFTGFSPEVGRIVG